MPDQTFYKNCFEVDWKYSKLSFMIQDPHDKGLTKSILKYWYKDILNVYKYFSGIEI